MGQFLRDQRIKNVTIDEAMLDRLNNEFVSRLTAHNQGLEGEAHVAKRALFFYVIRFDDKGYRFVNFADVKRCFRDAGEVERVIYTMDSGANRQSSGLFGTFFELRLDRDENSCWLQVSADNKDWVDATFSACSDILTRQRSASRFIRTQWTNLLVQLVGVAIGFLLSLWAAFKIAPLLDMDNAFVITFFFALLIFSNLWGYINAQIARFLNYTCPNVRFKRPGRDMVQIGLQYVIVSLLLVFFAFLLDKLFTLIGAALSALLK